MKSSSPEEKVVPLGWESYKQGLFITLPPYVASFPTALYLICPWEELFSGLGKIRHQRATATIELRLNGGG